MMDTRHYTFVKIHRTYNTKSESEGKRWTLGDDVLMQILHLWLVYHSGGGTLIMGEAVHVVRAGSIWAIFAPSIQFCCVPQTALKKLSLIKLKQGLYVNLGSGGCGGRWEVSSKGRGYVYSYCCFMLRFDRKQQNFVKQLSFN